MESTQPPLLLIPSPFERLDVHVHVPRPNDNLFERLIRNPQAPDRPMRERQCTEMLRGVLVACPTLASAVFTWLAEVTGIPVGLVDELEWSLETEQAIGSKRDDLRIEGWSRGDDEARLGVIWTIEVKVAAPLHESGVQDWGDDSAEPTDDLADDPEVVIQLVNYDSWLDMQDVEHRAGVVLAVRDVSSAVPDGLTQRWECLTWTDFALQVEKALVDDLLPAPERLLAKHMLGFIRHRLWDPTDMSTSRLELDDVALLRALAAIGPSCSRKVKDLVNQFEQLVKDTGIDFVDIRSSSSRFFDRTEGIEYGISARCLNDERGEVSVAARVVTDHVRVSISTYPKGCEANVLARKIINECEDQLTERNPDWGIVDLDDSEYRLAEISKPLVSVLDQEDWQAPLINFVQAALDDLKELGILESLGEIQFDKDESS